MRRKYGRCSFLFLFVVVPWGNVYMCIITLYGMDFVGIIFSRWMFYVAMKQILSGAKSMDLVAM